MLFANYIKTDIIFSNSKDYYAANIFFNLKKMAKLVKCIECGKETSSASIGCNCGTKYKEGIECAYCGIVLKYSESVEGMTYDSEIYRGYDPQHNRSRYHPACALRYPPNQQAPNSPPHVVSCPLCNARNERDFERREIVLDGKYEFQKDKQENVRVGTCKYKTFRWTCQSCNHPFEVKVYPRDYPYIQCSVCSGLMLKTEEKVSLGEGRFVHPVCSKHRSLKVQPYQYYQQMKHKLWTEEGPPNIFLVAFCCFIGWLLIQVPNVFIAAFGWLMLIMYIITGILTVLFSF
jgi:predicted nucleic acid-binding Zn ribbon protein